jgi:conjugative relaxase-like TrwC/TraI family protein
VLGVHAIGVGRHGYYLQTVTAGARPGTRYVEPDGDWTGAAAAGLGLRRLEVNDASLAALFGGVDPASGRILDAHHGRVRVAAFDCTFSPPKTVSLLHGLGSPHLSAEAGASHLAAVEAAFGYLERRAAALRRTEGGKRRVVPAASGLCAAAFLHRTSRAGDPHLHSHVLVANLACDDEGRWSALDGRQLFLHAVAASELYAAHLRAELVSRLGVRFDPASASRDVAGIDRRLVLAFSRRSQAISTELAVAAARGAASQWVAEQTTRPPKDLSRSYEELRSDWHGRAVGLGLSPRRLGELAGSRPLSPPRPRDPGDPPLGGLSRRGLVAWYARAQRDGAPAGEIEHAVDELVATGRLLPSGLARPRLSSHHPHGRAAPGGVSRHPRFPAGIEEELVVTPATLALQRDWRAALASAPADAPERADPPAVLPAVGLNIAVLTGDALQRACSISALARRHAESGRGVLAVVPGPRRLAAGYEAITGVPALPAGDRLPFTGDAVLLVPHDLVSRRPALAAQVLARARRGHPVVVCVQAAARVVEGGSTEPEVTRRAPGLAPPRLLRCAEVGIVAAGDAESLLSRLCADWAELSSAGASPVIATPDGELAALVTRCLRAVAPAGSPRRPPHEEGRWESPLPEPAVVVAPELSVTTPAQHSGPLLVLGPARLVPRAERTGGHRRHYVVAPAALPAGALEGWLLECGEPRHVVARIGPPPSGDLAQRHRWREAAVLATSAHGGRESGTSWQARALESPGGAAVRPGAYRAEAVPPAPFAAGLARRAGGERGSVAGLGR